jgi:D-glycero-D-manno-heptose 1,7-bisphosphate phosphatase
MNSAIFIDKDGTLIKDIPYNADPSLISLEMNMVKGLKMLRKAGFKLFLVSNQSGIALGYFDYPQLLLMENRLKSLLMEQGIKLDGCYYCPHHPNGVIAEYSKNCNCRKPLPGLLKIAAEAHQIDLSRSWMIGDILDDIQAGNMAGCQTVLINNGNETEWLRGANRRPTFIAPDINTAATFMLENAVSTYSTPLTQLQ